VRAVRQGVLANKAWTDMNIDVRTRRKRRQWGGHAHEVKRFDLMRFLFDAFHYYRQLGIDRHQLSGPCRSRN